MELLKAIDTKQLGKYRYQVLNTASAVALAAVLSPALVAGAQAQTAPGGLETVEVSASRITTAGFAAPTPTTVIGTADIEQKAEVNLMNTLVQIPSMTGTFTQQAVASSSTIGGDFLNLRNLGANRVLVLMDGQRVVGANTSGEVDISEIPQALVKRVDIVTGGASASWGSDAVSGVSNFILDNSFSGFKANINGGITTYGDDPTGQVQLTAGSDLFGNRAHIVVSGDLSYDQGIHGDGNRPWYSAEKVIPSSIAATVAGAPEYVRAKGVYEDQVSPGGIIVSGPLKGISFGPGGAPTNFTYGTNVADPFMIGGTPVDLGTSLDLASGYTRGNLYSRLSYNLTPDTSLWVSGNYSAVKGHVISTGAQFETGNLTIQCTNPYLPATVVAGCAANKITSFGYGTSNQDLGPVTSFNYRVMHRVAAGADGDFDMFGSNWTWDTYAEHGQNYAKSYSRGSVNSNLYTQAIDAVTGPAGTPICRSTLTNPSDGCVPLDVIGTGVAAANAVYYVDGSGAPNTRATYTRQEAASASMNGQPFSTWAGRVSVATGLEYREEAYNSPSEPQYGGFTQGAQGNYHVVEAFVETGVPLIDSPTWGQATLNIAGREEVYSTAGWISTWKVGFTYETPIEGLRLRGLQSRDVRAPEVVELFAPLVVPTGTGGNTVVDFLGANAGKTFTVPVSTDGNTALQAERSSNTQLGVVYSPDWFPGFSSSIDYWRLAIKGTIGTLTPQQIVDVCAQGNAQVCSNITRDSTGKITLLFNKVFNLGSTETDGFDVESDYNASLDDLLPSYLLPESGGTLTFRALGTEVSSFVTNLGIPGSTITHSVGELQQAQSVQTTQHWRILGSQGFNFSRWGMNFTERWTSAGVIGRINVQCQFPNCPVPTVAAPTINNNYVPSTMYVDIGGTYKFTDNFTGYYKVNNVSNADPTLAPVFNGRTNIAANGATGELLGRTFQVGIRILY